MHIMIGLLGTHHFTLTVKGLLISLAVVALTQCAEMANFFMEGKKRIMKGPQNEREEKMSAFKSSLPKIIPPMFFKNWMIYSAVVLLFAEVGRNSGF